MIKQVAVDALQSAGLGTQGVDLFLFNAPEKAKKCILVIESLDGVPRDEDLPGYKKADFQVIVRNPDYQSAMTIAKQVVNALDLHRTNVSGLSIKRMRAKYDPIAFPIPDSDVIEVSINMWAAYVEL